MAYHFVAPNGIGKNNKVSLFFFKLRPILEVSFLELSYSWQLSQSVTFEDKMPFLWRLCGCVVSHLDAFPNQSHNQQERHVKAQHGHLQSASSRAWGKRPALLSQPKAVRPGCDHRVALCLTKWFSHFSQFFGHYVNQKYLMLVGRWGTVVPPFCRQQPIATPMGATIL